MQKNKSGWCSFCGLLVIVFSLGVVYMFPPKIAWILVMALMVGFMIVLGVAISGRWLGILINEQNLMSLARFQTVVWTVIVISAYFVIAMVRINNQDKLEKTPAVTPTPTPASSTAAQVSTAPTATPTVQPPAALTPTLTPAPSTAAQISTAPTATPAPTVSIAPAAPDPLNISLSSELLALLGITATALVGSPLIAATKKSITPPASAITATAQELVRTNSVPQSVEPIAQKKAMQVIQEKGQQAKQQAEEKARAAITLTMATATDEEKKAAIADAGAKALATAEAEAKPAANEAKLAAIGAAIESNRDGALFKNPSVDDARFSDIFEGTEVGNAAHVDLGNVQMFYFTIIVALAYSVNIWSTLANGNLYGAQFVFPLLSPGMVALLGISNGGYLANKGVDHTGKGP